MSWSPAARYLTASAELLGRIDPAPVDALTEAIKQAWAADGAVLVCGNGGSASIATHMASDLIKQTHVPGRRPLRALSLADNMAVVTAWANDAGFSTVFAEQVTVHGRPGDLLICLSVSGNSANILEAIAAARAAGMTVATMAGFNGGAAADASDIAIVVPSDDYGAVESCFLFLQHCAATIARQDALLAARPELSATVIVDRDGVINRNRPDGVLRWEDFEFLPGALDALASFERAGFQVVVVTNQAAVGRVQLTRAQLEEIHRRMQEAVLAAGGRIAAVYACEHRPEDRCDCRKPAPGLLLRAAQELGFSLPDTYFIGDHESDVQAAMAAGARPMFVRSGRGQEGTQSPSIPVLSDLLSAARALTSAPELSLLADGAAAG